MTALTVEPAIIRIILRDGQSLKIRPGAQEDKGKLKDFFYRLSPLSRYLRFGCMKNYISEAELDCLTVSNPPDILTYVAVRGEDEAEKIVATGWWFLAPDKRVAEIAFMVEEKVQLRGIGTAFLEHFVTLAPEYGISSFIAYVLPENTKMMEVFDNSGLKLSRRKCEDTYEVILDLKEQEEYTRRKEYREHVACSAGVRKLLYPQSIAVIGPINEPGSAGHRLFRNLDAHGFNGRVFPIHYERASSGNSTVCPSLEQISAQVEVALLVAPPSDMWELIDQCAGKGIFGLIIFDTETRRADPAPGGRQAILAKKALAHGMRLLGSGCLGVMNADPLVRFNATMTSYLLRYGHIGVCSLGRTGGIALLNYLWKQGVGITHFVNLGDPLDVSCRDLWEFWEDDETTKAMLIYPESFAYLEDFLHLARRIIPRKPVIVLKARRPGEERPIASHAGAGFSRSDQEVEFFLEQAGFVTVRTGEELLSKIRRLTPS